MHDLQQITVVHDSGLYAAFTTVLLILYSPEAALIINDRARDHHLRAERQRLESDFLNVRGTVVGDRIASGLG